MLLALCPYDSNLYTEQLLLPMVWTPTLKKGEKINSRVVYGCPEKYLTQEKTDEAH
jgi:hypothetical protein